MESKNRKIPSISKGMTLFIIACALVCLIGFAYAIKEMITNQIRFSDSVKNIEEITVSSYKMLYNPASTNAPNYEELKEMSDATQMQLDTMTKMIDLQQTAASSDILSFIYTFVSTILLAVAIYLVRDIEEKHASIVGSVNLQEERLSELPKRMELESMCFLYIQQLDYYGWFMLQIHDDDPEECVLNSLVVGIRDKFKDIEGILEQCETRERQYILKQFMFAIKWFQQRLSDAYDRKRIDGILKTELEVVCKKLLTSIERSASRLEKK